METDSEGRNLSSESVFLLCGHLTPPAKFYHLKALCVDLNKAVTICVAKNRGGALQV